MGIKGQSILLLGHSSLLWSLLVIPSSIGGQFYNCFIYIYFYLCNINAIIIEIIFIE